MTTAAKTSFGAEFWMAPTGDTLVKIAELISVSPPKPQRGTIDVTTHDSPAGAQEFITEGVYDPGELSGQIHYIAGSTGDDAMIDAMTSGEMQDWKIVLKASAGTEPLTGSGYMTTYGPDDQPVNGKQTAGFTMKVSGAVEQGA